MAPRVREFNDVAGFVRKPSSGEISGESPSLRKRSDRLGSRPMSVRTSGVHQQSIWPGIVSDDVQRLRGWLLAMGFTEELLIPSERDGQIHHSQFDGPEGGRVILSSTGERDTPCRPGTHSLHV